MRKISYIGLAIAAVAITGCAKTDLSSIETAPSERSIDFGGYLSRPTNSKAEGIVDVDAFKKDGTFKAWAFVTQDGTGHDAPLSTAVAIKAHSTLDGKSDFAWVEGAGAPIIPQWKSGDTKHLWQDVGLGLTSFYAISSKQTLTLKAPVVGSTPVSASFDYTVGTIENDTETAEDNQEDLIAAQKLDLFYDIAATNPGQVEFDFAHLLTQVRFTVKASAADFKLKVLDIRLVDVASEGTFNFDPTEATIGTWAVDEASAKVTYNYFNALAGKGQNADFPDGFPATTADIAANFISNAAAVDLPLFGGAKATDCLMLLPSVAMDGANAIGLKGVKLSVTYQCYIWTGDDPETDIANWEKDGGAITRVIEFTEAEKWEMNKRISYNLTLFNSDSGKIIYDPTTSNWTDESSDSNLKPEDDVVPPVVTP